MFSGFAHPFRVTASAGRVAVERDYELYLRSLILQVLLTRPGERINRPTFGAGVRALVFAPLSDATAALAQAAVLKALDEWVSELIRTEDVRVEVEAPSTLRVVVIYLVRATNERRFLNVEVTE